MKKLLFAIGAVALAFTMTACGDLDVDSVGIDVQRPGAPGSVTATASPCGNFVLVSWRAGANTTEDQFEVVARPSGSQTAFSLPATGTNPPILPLANFVTAWDAPITGSGISIQSNRMTFSWNDDSTLSWEANNDIDRFYRVVRLALVNREPIPNLQIGVRAQDVFHENWYHQSHSAVVWAGGTFASTRFFTPQFDPSLPVAADHVITGAVNQPVNLNTAFNIAEDLLPAGAELRLRWDVRTTAGVGGVANVLVESSGGVFTPSFGGNYTATATIIGTTTTRTVTVAVTGAQFIPGNIGVPTVTSNTVFAPSVPITPTNASAIGTPVVWEMRSRPWPPTGPTDPNAPASLQRPWGPWTLGLGPIPPNHDVEVRGTLNYGVFWVEERRDPSNPLIPGTAGSAHRRRVDSFSFVAP